VNPFQDSSSSFEDIDDVSLLAIALQELQVGTDEDVHHNNSETLEQRATAIVYAARALARGELIGWHQGRSEFGPRALGSRSLLADPRNATLAAYLNAEVKKREAFRPFAPAVLAEEADDWFMDLTVKIFGSLYIHCTERCIQSCFHARACVFTLFIPIISFLFTTCIRRTARRSWVSLCRCSLVKWV